MSKSKPSYVPIIPKHEPMKPNMDGRHPSMRKAMEVVYGQYCAACSEGKLPINWVLYPCPVLMEESTSGG